MARSKKAKAHTHPEPAAVAAGAAPIVAATIEYERWLHDRVDVVKEDLEDKHRQMTGSLFAFLRATFYRWGPLWLEVCPDLADTPRLLAVGDLHVENFGTWRDSEGRLVWGVNDFDEVAEMPYALDLVRLVTSAILAKHENGLAIDASSAAAAALDGYAQALKDGGKPFILEEDHPNLRDIALGAERDPVRFWSKLTKAPPLGPPKHIQRLLHRSLPDGAGAPGYSRRTAGVGSLGRPRYVATACCEGGLVAREAKAWLPSAWGWAKGRPKERAFSLRLLKHAVRQPDPYYTVEDGWVVRRIGPHCGRIELADCPKRRDERMILKDMGRETANLHLATADQRHNVLHDLSERKPDWLLNAAQAMAKETAQDWESFRSSPLASSQPSVKTKGAGDKPAPS